jgi:acylphosphatase
MPFRYEVQGNVRGTGLPSALVAEADRLGCFGWVQNTAQGTLVGEARCNNINGPKLAAWLQSGSARPQLATVDKVLLVKLFYITSTCCMLQLIVCSSMLVLNRHLIECCYMCCSRNTGAGGCESV